MDHQTSLPVWLILLLIVVGVIMAVVIAMLLTQFDALQQRTVVPQEPMTVVDHEATITAGELTVVVIAGEKSTATAVPEATPSPMATSAIEKQPATATPEPILVPTCTTASKDWIPYLVQEGDTLSFLSSEYGIGVEMLLEANCLTDEPLIPGQIILVPPSKPTRIPEIVCHEPAGWEFYETKAGDTLAILAKQRNTTVRLIMQANCIIETFLVPGTRLLLPPPIKLIPEPPAHFAFPTPRHH